MLPDSWLILKRDACFNNIKQRINDSNIFVRKKALKTIQLIAEYDINNKNSCSIPINI